MAEINIKTFKDLYLFLQIFNGNLFEWLEIPWKGKDKQESIFRLFSYLNLLNKLNNYDVCKGNYNLQTIEKIKNMNDIFYNEKHKKIKLKDKGDSSDLTFINKTIGSILSNIKPSYVLLRMLLSSLHIFNIAQSFCTFLTLLIVVLI